jgi:lipopolysaccharide export system permease protein
MPSAFEASLSFKDGKPAVRSLRTHSLRGVTLEHAGKPLMRAIDDLKAAGRRADNLEGILWHKLSGPLSTLLMPLLGAVAAFGLARSGALFLRAVIGMALGFTYFVADNFALAMGNLGAYPPWIAAWGPFLLFFLIGETVLVRTDE